MTFNVTILGCGAAVPTLRNHPSAQVVNLHDKLFLVDCGEGTQLRMRDTGIKFQKINHVFISHLHGDHYLGIFGYIATMNLLGRTTTLHIYASGELEDLIRLNLQHSFTQLKFKLDFHPLTYRGQQLIHEDKTLEVYSFPLKHRIDCCGFLFREKQKPLNVKKSVIAKFGLAPSEIISLKNGIPVQHSSGRIVSPADACTAVPPALSYAYCSDTAYNEKMLESLAGVNLLYHESTFLEKDKKRAKETYHSTARQAASVAMKAGAGKLLLGHFSARYKTSDEFVSEASEIFPNVEVAEETKVYRVE